MKRLNVYLSKELRPDEEALVQRHISQCKGCFAKFHFEETLLRTIRESIAQVRAPIPCAKKSSVSSLPTRNNMPCGAIIQAKRYVPLVLSLIFPKTHNIPRSKHGFPCSTAFNAFQQEKPVFYVMLAIRIQFVTIASPRLHRMN